MYRGLDKTSKYYSLLTRDENSCNFKLDMKSTARKLKSNPLSQFLIVTALAVVLLALFESNTNSQISPFGTTQLFVVAGVLGILGIYIKDEKL